MKQQHYENDIIEIVNGIKKEYSILKSKKVLLVGANGFLGKYFVKVFEKIIEEKKTNFLLDCYDNHISSKKIENKLGFVPSHIFPSIRVLLRNMLVGRLIPRALAACLYKSTCWTCLATAK